MLLQKSIAAIFSILLLVTLILGLLKLIKPQQLWHELSLRLRT